jgi:ATP-dependent DNA helicase DinG
MYAEKDHDYQTELQGKAHAEADRIFRTILPEAGLTVREEQVRLCHQMLAALLDGSIALCDAGVGIGKTYAYLVACILMKKYRAGRNGKLSGDSRTVVISTSSIALQEAIVKEYIPFLSGVFLKSGIIDAPLKAVVRKGKEHFVCDSRLDIRLEAVREKDKNPAQKQALLSLRQTCDMDAVPNLSGFDRRQVCVPKFCPGECPGRTGCRYQTYLRKAKDKGICFQICNHNYLLADASHRAKDFKPLLSDYRALIVDEAHKLPEAARQMYGKSLGYEDILEICGALDREYQHASSQRMKQVFTGLFQTVGETHRTAEGISPSFCMSEECRTALEEGKSLIRELADRLRGKTPGWILNRLEEAGEVLSLFSGQGRRYILHLTQERGGFPVLCATSRKTPELLSGMLWSRRLPAILTSGTLKAGNGFSRTRQENGLGKDSRVREYVAQSPFAYEENCLLYLPQTLRALPHGSREEAVMLAKHILKLVCSTYGHTLVLFTSYSLMGSVYQLLRDSLPFPLVEVWRNAQDQIMHFKKLENAVLFAAGSCWEGVDFPGDMVSSLIIVKLPFAVPDPLSEAEKENYDSLQEYIREIIVPDMQKKLRQGFGRAIRTERDTCVVTILDHRAVEGGRYHEDVLRALPACRMASDIEDVKAFIHCQKNVEYYM